MQLHGILLWFWHDKEDFTYHYLPNIVMIYFVYPAAILTAGCPDKVAFFADEPAHMALSTTTLKYSMAEYMSFVEVIRILLNNSERKVLGIFYSKIANPFHVLSYNNNKFTHTCI